jgi:TRAP transporter TAXI family solute receptor
MYRSKVSLVITFVLCLSFVLFSGAAAQSQALFIKIGTGFPGGLWYPASAILAANLETALREAGIEAHCSIQSTPGALNVAAVNEGVDMQLTLTQAQNQYLAFKGLDPYQEPLKNLCLVGTQEFMITQIVVPAASEIHSVPELVNKTINGGRHASTDRIMMEALLKAYGMTFDDVGAAGGNVMALGWDDAAALMQDGHMDCIGTFGGLMPSIVNLIVQPGIRFLSIGDEQLDKLLADPTMQGFVKATMQPNTYDGQNYAVNTFAVPTTILANINLPEDIAYIITKTIYESGYHSSPFGSTEAKGWPKICNPEDLPKVANIPVHPGTIKYLKEKGIELPE